MGNLWYTAVAGETAGPHSRETMERLRAGGEISDDTPVWCEGMANWIPYADSGLGAPGLFPAESDAAAGFPARTAHPWSDFDNLSSLFAPEESPAARMPPLVVEDDGWQITRATPWRRYFARMFDTVILGVLTWFVLGFVFAACNTRLFNIFFGAHGLADNTLLSTVATFLVMVPVEAVMLGLCGTTVGKWVFGVRITQPGGHAIGLLRAGKREASVLLRGLGLGIPLVSLVTMIVGYRTLADTGFASWDEGKPWVVTYRESGPLQILLSVAGVSAWLFALAAIQVVAKTKG